MEKHREGRNLLPRTRLRTDRRHIISRICELLLRKVPLYTRKIKKGCVGGVVDTWHVRENHPTPVPDSHTRTHNISDIEHAQYSSTYGTGPLNITCAKMAPRAASRPA